LSNFSNVNVFNPFFGETTPIELSFDATSNADKTEISLKITVKNAAEHQLNDLVLFAALAEELVDFSSPNGESEHHNVFRQAFTDIEGDAITIDGVSGNEFEFNYTVPLNSELSAPDVFAYVILQQSGSKEVVQAAKNNTGAFVVPVGINDVTLNKGFYPNPVKDILQFDRDFNNYKANIFNVNGELVKRDLVIQNNKMDLSTLNSGIYMLSIFNSDAQFNIKLIKE